MKCDNCNKDGMTIVAGYLHNLPKGMYCHNCIKKLREQCKKCGVSKEIHYPIGLPAMVWDCSKECKIFEVIR